MVKNHIIFLKFSQKNYFGQREKKNKRILLWKCSVNFQKNTKERECFYSPQEQEMLTLGLFKQA